MKIINLKAILNKSNYQQAGSCVFDIMDSAENTSEVFVLDMDGVISIPTMFMNTSFGAYIDKYGVEELRTRIKFKNITKVQAECIQKYLFHYEKLIKIQ